MLNKIYRRKDFLYPIYYTEIPIRMPNTRQIQYISTEELAYSNG
jgi:hypothetical protein